MLVGERELEDVERRVLGEGCGVAKWEEAGDGCTERGGVVVGGGRTLNKGGGGFGIGEGSIA